MKGWFSHVLEWDYAPVLSNKCKDFEALLTVPMKSHRDQLLLSQIINLDHCIMIPLHALMQQQQKMYNISVYMIFYSNRVEMETAKKTENYISRWSPGHWSRHTLVTPTRPTIDRFKSDINLHGKHLVGFRVWHGHYVEFPQSFANYI